MHANQNTKQAPKARSVNAARKLAMAAATAALCTGAGCASNRTHPEGLYKKGMMHTACLPEMRAGMKELGIKPGEERQATLLIHRMDPDYDWEQTPYNESLGVTDKVGEVPLQTLRFRLLGPQNWGKLVAHQSWLEGKMYIDKDRVYGIIQTAIIEPRTPREKEVEVCMEVYDIKGKLGMPKVLPDFKSLSIMTHSTVIVKAVEHYE